MTSQNIFITYKVFRDLLQTDVGLKVILLLGDSEWWEGWGRGRDIRACHSWQHVQLIIVNESELHSFNSHILTRIYSVSLYVCKLFYIHNTYVLLLLLLLLESI